MNKLKNSTTSRPKVQIEYVLNSYPITIDYGVQKA